MSNKLLEKKSLELAIAAARVCHDRRSEDIAILDLRRICDYTDYFVIATAKSSTQLKGIIKEIERELKKKDALFLSRTGMDGGGWVVLDCGDAVVHLFDDETRDFYELDQLWADAPQVDWMEGK